MGLNSQQQSRLGYYTGVFKGEARWVLSPGFSVERILQYSTFVSGYHLNIFQPPRLCLCVCLWISHMNEYLVLEELTCIVPLRNGII